MKTSGQKLSNSGHYAADEIRLTLSSMENAWDELIKSWRGQNLKLCQARDLQVILYFKFDLYVFFSLVLCVKNFKLFYSCFNVYICFFIFNRNFSVLSIKARSG